MHEYLEREYVREHGEAGAAEPTGLLVLPHFAGAATPYMDTGSKGAVIGLTAAHTVSDIYRACMEGVACEMMLNLEWLKGSGIRFQMLHATGGGAFTCMDTDEGGYSEYPLYHITDFQRGNGGKRHADRNSCGLF